MNPTNPKVDAFLERATQWREEMEKLRAILLGFPLTEELKWGKPCYTFRQGNVVIIVAFKECCALLFCKGALLNDPSGVLVQPTENTQAARQLRFTRIQQIVEMETIIKSTVENAVEVEKAGLEVSYKQISEFAVPDELQVKLDESPHFKTAFKSLTPGRQRAYLLHFSAPKQPKTRESRIEKCKQQILEGKGLNDR